jgi:hypothetical protein
MRREKDIYTKVGKTDTELRRWVDMGLRGESGDMTFVGNITLS